MVNGMKIKKIAILLLAVMIVFTLSACAQSTDEVVEETSAHTIPPTQAVTTDYEWAEIDCDITLTDADSNVVAFADDFEMFALVGTNDDDSCIRLKLSENATSMLCSVGEQTLTVSINSQVVDSVTISPDTFDGEFEICSDLSFESLCELATTIRGLFY